MGCLFLVIAISRGFVQSHEPSYNGRPLDEWVTAMSPMPGYSDPYHAKIAVRHFGTNAVPKLLEWIAYEPRTSRPLADVVGRLIGKLPNSVQRRIPAGVWRWVESDMVTARADGAAEAFAALGPTAAAATPHLEALLRDRAKTNTCRRAMYALAAISTNIHPEVIARLADPDPQQRIWGIAALASYSTNVRDATPGVPLLINCMHDTNAAVRFCAGCALGQINVAPNRVVPELTTALSSQDLDVRFAATNALRNIERRALTNAPPHH